MFKCLNDFLAGVINEEMNKPLNHGLRSAAVNLVMFQWK